MVFFVDKNKAFCLVEHQQRLLTAKHRGLVVLIGESVWCAEQMSAFALVNKNEQKVFNYHCTVDIGSSVNDKNYRHFLGQESDIVLFSGDSFNPDAFAALAGTLKAGGYFFLYFTVKPNSHSSYFLQRFYRELIHHQSAIFIEQELQTTVEFDLNHYHKPNKLADKKEFKYACINQQQELAVEAIHRTFSGHRNRPLVITADRGRGKSTALALACIDILQQVTNPTHIIITAPKVSALDSFFKHLAASFPDEKIIKNKLTYQNSTVTFMPFDLLLKEKPKAHLLLVDEAAALPVYLLKQLFQSFHRTVFASTLHGYEGSGRGFILKFQQLLLEKKYQSHEVVLSEPIRWGNDDPLEKFVFDGCLLNAEYSAVELGNDQLKKINLDDYCYQEVSAKSLLDNENLLRQIFAILVEAHYQTSPSDLKLLLDNQSVKVLILTEQEIVISVALIMIEGHCDNEAVSLIKQGKKRIKNHFLPQSLMAHCGAEDAFEYRYWRIMRIAVHPALQNKGVGRYFVNKIEEHARQYGIDLIGTSFGLNIPLYRFWSKEDWQLARIGFTRDQSSGEYSAILLKPIVKKAKVFVNNLSVMFSRAFPFLLTQQFQDLVTPLALIIFHDLPNTPRLLLTEIDKANVEAYGLGYRQYDNCAFSLHLWLLFEVSKLNEHSLLKDKVLSALAARLLQNHSIEKVCSEYDFTGKKALNCAFVNLIEKYTESDLNKL